MKKIIIRLIDQNFPKIADKLRKFRDERMLKKAPKLTKFGFYLSGNVEMQSGNFEPQETKLFQSEIKKYDLFINVGANIGYYCCLASKSEVHCIAFEPLPLNLKYLFKNIKSNKWEGNIEVYPIGIGTECGIAELYGDNTGASLIKGWANSSDKNFVSVPINSLDNLLGNRFNGKNLFIMIDIEGAEFNALKGSKLILDYKPSPTWFVEVCINEHQPYGLKINPNLLETFDIFWNSGYRAYTAIDSQKMVTRLDILNIIDSGIDTLGFHNFIFKK